MTGQCADRRPDYSGCCGVAPLAFRRFFLIRASTKRSIIWPNRRRGFLVSGLLASGLLALGTPVAPPTLGGGSFSKVKAGMTSPFNIELSTPGRSPCHHRVRFVCEDNPARLASVRLDCILCQNQAKLQHVADFSVRF